MRVLFLINSLAGGGAERVMLSIVAGSRDRLAEGSALALLDDDRDAYPPPVWLPVHRLSTGGSLPRGFRALRALVRSKKPDLIVSFLTRANVIAAAVGSLEGVRTVISERVNTSAHLSGLRAVPSRLLVRLAYPRADRIIAVSQGVADDLARNFGVEPARITAIANPVDLAAIRARADEAAMPPLALPYFIAVGRLTHTKNMALLVRAYRDAQPAARLLILGEGPERETLQAEIARLGLNGRIVLGGFSPNPFALVAQAHAYVSASNGEGFPNALVEAMALERPVIATNCASGPSEILVDRPRESIAGPLDTPHGRLVPTDDQASLAAALRWIDTLSDAERVALGMAGRARAEDYSVDRAVQHYWAVFANAASSRQ
ncbi:glycosyltransferase [Sphingomonas sp.]|jgi:N-acetylgalactosamine-N,N'-diacetylbacillosaminyl-diphospho-undecaprenol 4-alpha-N-acetylgalactosaminyltransferase|uniref:glycosyltransferase n=1 Tax=Sphingomonas sp. TaxID=28214 RepID=UPI002ED9392B